MARGALVAKMLIASIGVLFLLSGCGMTQAQVSMLNENSTKYNEPVVCQHGDECKLMWDRAMVWIAKYSVMRIQASNDSIISTYGPIGTEIAFGFNVYKEPIGGSQSRITMEVLNCGNMFGCNMEPSQVKGAFYKYISTGEDILKGGYYSPLRNDWQRQ